MCVTVVPGAVVPSPNAQKSEYGAVPPVTLAVNVTLLPTVGFAGVNVKLAVKGCGKTVTAWLTCWVFAGLEESVTVTLTV